MHNCGQRSCQLQEVRAATEIFPSSSRETHVCSLFLQGGGVFVEGGTVTFSSCTISGNRANDVRAPVQNFPSLLIGNSRFAQCLQGGGVLVDSGRVTITSSSIYGNTAEVRAHLQKFPSPLMGESLTCLHRLTLAQLRTLRPTTACTCHRYLANFPSPRWENC